MRDTLTVALRSVGLTVYDATPSDAETRGRAYAVLDWRAMGRVRRASGDGGYRDSVSIRCCGSTAQQAIWAAERAWQAAWILPPHMRDSVERHGVVRDTSVPADIRYSVTVEITGELSD